MKNDEFLRLLVLIQIASQIISDKTTNHEDSESLDTQTIGTVVNFFSGLLLVEKCSKTLGSNEVENMCNGDRLKGFMPVSWKSTLYADDEHGYDTEESTFNAMKTVEWIQQVERAFEVQSVRFSNNYHMDLTKKSTEDKITQTDNCLTDKPSTLTEGSIEKTITV